MWLLVLPHSTVTGFQEQAFIKEAGYDLASEDLHCHFCRGHKPDQIQGREHRIPSFSGRSVKVTSQEHVDNFVAIIFGKYRLEKLVKGLPISKQLGGV